jgi:hypothetical protein
MRMDVRELYRRTGITPRRLRYVLDHKLVPELPLETVQGRHGSPRRFSEEAGCAIVCAVLLLHFGLNHQAVKTFMRGILELEVPLEKSRKPALSHLLEHAQLRAYAELGDGRYVRILVRDGGETCRTPWHRPGDESPLGGSYRPAVKVVLNLTRIRDAIRGHRKLA